MLNLELITFSGTTNEILQLPLLFLPKIILAIVLVLVGWFIGWIIERLIESIFRALPFFDEALRNIGLEEITKRAGLRISLGRFFGVVLKIFVIFVFLVAALDVLQLQTVSRFIVEVVLGYIPNVISAALILIIGFVVASFISNLITGTAKAANVNGGVAAKVAKWAIVVLSIFIAIGELGIAPNITQGVIFGIITALSLALGLAFGLGGQQAAADFLNKVRNDVER